MRKRGFDIPELKGSGKAVSSSGGGWVAYIGLGEDRALERGSVALIKYTAKWDVIFLPLSLFTSVHF